MMRYRASSTYYDAGASIGTNFWKLLNQVNGFANIGIHSVLTVTQILSMAGIGAEYNMMAWAYAGLAESVLGAASGLVYLYAQDAYWRDSQDAASATAADSATALAGLKSDALEATAGYSAAAIDLYMHVDDWKDAQWAALSPE